MHVLLPSHILFTVNIIFLTGVSECYESLKKLCYFTSNLEKWESPWQNFMGNLAPSEQSIDSQKNKYSTFNSSWRVTYAKNSIDI